MPVRHPHDVDLPVRVDRADPAPLPAQLVQQLRELVVSGALRPGDPLPSTRGLAARLGISRGSVVTAYDQLHGEGYLHATNGATIVHPDLARSRVERAGPRPDDRSGARPSAPPQRRTRDRPMIDLTPGRPDTARLATPGWRAAWRDAAAAAAGAAAPPAQGAEPLREQIAEHLRLMRGVVRDPQDLFVTAGARDGLQLLLAALGGLAGRPLRVAVEDPGYPSLRRVPERLGHRVLPVPIDDHGLDPARLPSGAWSGAWSGDWEIDRAPDAVVVTPSHQYPLGASMPAARRLELLDWARAHDALIVEDDYDSELRYVGEPLPALSALDHGPGAVARPPAPGRRLGGGGHVATLGSFTKVLAPGLGVGYLVAPPALREELLRLRTDLGNPASAVAQDAMARFLAGGGLRRHTARMRREYRRRRDLLGAALAGVRGVRAVPMDGGLHAVLEFTGEVAFDERDVVARAAAAGVRVAALGSYWAEGARGGRRGVVVGFGATGAAPEGEALPDALGVLARVLSAPGRASGAAR
ncbi:HTH-type pyridoxine biosynthesis transcriptional regulator PdxR [Kocuria turfanensis]|uniref:HTH-type pyridoxine biosynthesis transcriptional regulator PdxR n=1 Tax=Kocuria turfanensis TaxID=388357 RepID=A0A512I9K5_9MICC|nr:HTH-type pyridoxine biosynthesis transcriptional regulator PdxR [Kocuria turfanensis]